MVIIMESKVKQALTFVAEMIVNEFDITENNVFKFDLEKLVTEWGVKKTYSDFVSMCILTSFNY